jgi:hypothetical protein
MRTNIYFLSYLAQFFLDEKYFRQICRKYTNFMFSNFFSDNRVAYEMIWKNILGSDRP